jgi:hypothetical protein
MAIIKNSKEEPLTYKDMTIEDIISWCKKHGEIEWLKAKAAEKVEYKVYPKVREPHLDEMGNLQYTKKGKVKMHYVADKTKEPVIEMRPISFVQIKEAFIEKFMPEIKPKAKEKATMYDIIAAL